MAELATLARPYAEAVFGLAKEAGNFDEWSEGLTFLVSIIEQPLISAVIANPRVDKTIVTELLLDICSEQKVSDSVKNLVKVLIDNHKLRVLPKLLELYEQLKAQQQGYIPVEIVSTYEVTPEQQQAVESALKKRFGKAVALSTTIDPSLVGGWLIRAGDQVIDLSIRGRLQQMAAELRR